MCTSSLGMQSEELPEKLYNFLGPRVHARLHHGVVYDLVDVHPRVLRQARGRHAWTMREAQIKERVQVDKSQSCWQFCESKASPIVVRGDAVRMDGCTRSNYRF